MLELEASWLISELLTIDRLSSGTVVVGEISSLSHEPIDNSVEMTA